MLKENLPVKKIIFGLVIICSGLITAYIVFIAGLSIYVGLQYVHKDGFWVPILFGLVILALVLWLFIYSIGYIRHQIEEKDIIHHL